MAAHDLQITQPARRLRSWTIALLALITLAATAYVFQYRYFARFVPVPIGVFRDIERLSPSPIAPKYIFNGQWEAPPFDLTTDEGLKKALTHIRRFSPIGSTGEKISYEDSRFETWLAQLPSKAAYCTDFSALFTLLASRDELPVREWWVWQSQGYEGGNAHSVVEFFNPETGRWQVVDPMNATIMRKADGTPAAMADVIEGYLAGDGSILYEELPVLEELGLSRGETRRYIEPMLLMAPVLNLKPPTWFAETPKLDWVIAYAILTGSGGHSIHVYSTKVALFFSLICAVAMVRLLFYRRSASSVRG